jgi:hypothetical protein
MVASESTQLAERSETLSVGLRNELRSCYIHCRILGLNFELVVLQERLAVLDRIETPVKIAPQ